MTAFPVDAIFHGATLIQDYPLFAAAAVGNDPDTLVTVNGGDWLDIAAKVVILLLGLATTAVMTVIPFWARGMIYSWKLDKVVQDAAAAAILKVRDKLKTKLGPGGVITFDVKNAAIDDTIQTVLDTTSKWVISAGGGPDQVAVTAAAWVEKLITSTSTTYEEAPRKTSVVAVKK